MQHGEFLGIVKGLARLNPGHRQQILDRLSSGIDQEEVNLISLLKRPECCPACGCRVLVFWGARKGLPRIRCKGCTTTFTVLSGSPLARQSHRERWLQYAGCLLDGLTIRSAAKECGISVPTSFRWRHRFLATIDSMKPPALKGVVEIDETLFRNSKKGDHQLGCAPRRRGTKAQRPGLSSEQVVVVVARDRHGTTTDYILPKFNAETVAGALKTVIAPDSLLCTDASTVLAAFASKNGLLHYAINASAGHRVEFNTFHVQNVNAYHSRMKHWMARFHGVSAKWLSRYLGWWRMLDGRQSELTPDEVLRYASA